MGKNRQNNKGSHITALPCFLSLLALFFLKGMTFPVFSGRLAHAFFGFSASYCIDLATFNWLFLWTEIFEKALLYGTLAYLSMITVNFFYNSHYSPEKIKSIRWDVCMFVCTGKSKVSVMDWKWLSIMSIYIQNSLFHWGSQLFYEASITWFDHPMMEYSLLLLKPY